MTIYIEERQRVSNLAPNGNVSREFAEEIIRKSAYWYSHPSGQPQLAKGHADRIENFVSPKICTQMLLQHLKGEKNIEKPKHSNYSIEFGANIFLISQAIVDCQKTLLNYIDSAEKGEIIPITELRLYLKIGVRNSVLNYQNKRYISYGDVEDRHMIFGAQSIDTDSFINVILRKVNLARIISKSK